MFFTIGSPKRLDALGRTVSEMSELKKKVEIAIIDDEPFLRADSLRHHDFQLRELGGDIRTVEQVASFPIVVCDIKSVGLRFGSRHEGAHVLAEIRKSFPDKYLVAFTGMTFDVSYNADLASADRSIAKDAPTETWVHVLEEGLTCVSDPRIRWKRFRKYLLERDVELYDVFKLEQTYVMSVNTRDRELLKSTALLNRFSPEVKDLIIKFAVAGAGQIIEKIVLGHTSGNG